MLSKVSLLFIHFNRDCDKFVSHDSGSGFTAMWQCFYCHMAMSLLPYSNFFTATWQCFDWHMTMSLLKMAVSYCQVALVLLQCASQSAQCYEIFETCFKIAIVVHQRQSLLTIFIRLSP